MRTISLNGLVFQSIINIIIERKPFHKGSLKIDPFEKKYKKNSDQSFKLFRSI